MKVRIIGLLLGVMFIAASVHGQEKLLLDDILAIAIKQNFDIQLFRLGSDSAAITNRYAIGGFLPTLNATGGYTKNNNLYSKNVTFGDSVIIREDARTSGLNGAVQLSWTLFDGTRMFATRKRVSQLAELGVLRLQNQMINSMAAVSNNYYNIVRQKQQLKAINELMSVNEERVKLADKKLQVGTGGKPELLQAKVDLNTQRVAAIQQETLISQLKDQLNGLLGMALPAVYDVGDTIPINLSLTLDEILNNVEQTNKTLSVARQNVEVSKTQVWETRALRSPVISFSSAYNYGRTENATATSPVAQKLSQNRGYNYGLFVTVPILNYFNVNRNIDLSKIRLKRLELVYEQQKSIASVGVRVAYINYENSKRTLQIAEENIRLARENVFIALETFKRGLLTSIDVRTAQQSLSDVYNQLIAARYNAKIAETELLRLQGTLLSN